MSLFVPVAGERPIARNLLSRFCEHVSLQCSQGIVSNNFT